MRDRRAVLYKAYLQADSLKRTDCRLSARAGALDHDVYPLEPVLHSLPSRRLRSHLRCERSTLLGTLEAHCARTCPRDQVTLRIRNGHDSVIESGLNVGDTWAIFFFSLALTRPTVFFANPGLPPYFFLFAPTVRLGPLGVRALVLVRCPRTGKPRGAHPSVRADLYQTPDVHGKTASDSSLFDPVLALDHFPSLLISPSVRSRTRGAGFTQSPGDPVTARQPDSKDT